MMICRKSFTAVAAALTVGGMLWTGFADLALAATALQSGQTVNGFVTAGSRTYRYQTRSGSRVVTLSAAGEEYTFNARQGDFVTVTVDPETGSSLAPILVLLNAQNGQQVAFDDRLNVLRYRIPTAGPYQLLVLGRGNSRGRYSLNVVGFSGTTTANNGTNTGTNTTTPNTNDNRRKFLETEYGLRVMDSCPNARAGLVVVNFREFGQTFTYCATPNRNVKAGEYVYDTASDSLKDPSAVATTPNPTPTTPAANDPRRRLLENDFGLRVMDNCPATRAGLVVVNFREYGQNYLYCANPNRTYKAGEYTYDPVADDLKPGSLATNPGTGTTTTTPDARRKILEDDFGLRVMDTCPASRTALVAVNFIEGNNQTFTYCAQPNRLFTAGEYNYNPNTRNLEVARKTPNCTVQIGGICIVR